MSDLTELKTLVLKTQEKLNNRLKTKPLTRKQLLLLSQSHKLFIPPLEYFDPNSKIKPPKKTKPPKDTTNTQKKPNHKKFITLEQVLKEAKANHQNDFSQCT